MVVFLLSAKDQTQRLEPLIVVLFNIATEQNAARSAWGVERVLFSNFKFLQVENGFHRQGCTLLSLDRPLLSPL